ncbi:glycerol-3-phosphate acyltransferase PlsY [Thermonema lapsum]|uniref:Glycerol-3-phosphate acyltransferase n=1 Tax=Thermonema lapsum TaxID=28195 RepID=A0A846MSW2_9BACT|nr:glycerol-3-phosphate 1-O-acyltransferase PlsY [Thermonema lapsum]NIK74686.1 glycerol-3-phosphate acyltransferase PlsY [Thermonema lapsum]
MNGSLHVALFLPIAYLLGSVPSSVWIGKRFFGVDVREHGSGNAGATNTFRVLGKQAGSIVLALDILKGWIATQLPVWLGQSTNIDSLFLWQMAFGLCAIMGHIYSVFLNFKGGKGVAASLGMAISLHWAASLIAVVVFLLVLLVSHFVSLGSMLATLAFALVVNFELLGATSLYFKYFSWFMVALVIYTHRSNIKRLLGGNENKVYLFGKKSTH